MAEIKANQEANDAVKGMADLKVNDDAPVDRHPGYLPVGSAKTPWLVADVVAKVPEGPFEAHSESPVPFFHMLTRLKTTKREGWRRFGINDGESISDHMYRMSLISMFAPPSLASRINVSNCMKMALIHDMAEALVGDITPVDGVAKHEKNRREATTMDYLTETLLGKVNGGMTGKEIRAVWQEYEDSKTLDSHFVHDVDKIELILQMVEYEKKNNHRLDLGEFSWVATRIELEEVKEWSKTILKEREEFWGSKYHTTYSEKELPDPVALSLKKEYYGHRTGSPPDTPHDTPEASRRNPSA